MLGNKSSTDKSIRNCQDGAVGIIVAVLIVLLGFGILSLTLDTNKSQTIYLSAQNVSDSTSLNVSQLVTSMQIEGQRIEHTSLEKEAKEKIEKDLLQQNIGFKYDSANSNVLIETENADHYNKVTVNTCLNKSNDFASTKESKICVQSIAKTDKVNRIEVAIAVDNSANMARPIKNNPSKTGLEAAKDSLKFFSKIIGEHSNSYPAGTHISIIPYSDSVKLNPSVANPWLKRPYRPNTFNGCMGLRGNDYDKLDTPPDFINSALLYDRYKGPFDVPGAVRVIPKSASGNILKQITYTNSYKEDQNEMWIEFPITGNWYGIPTNSVINGHREGDTDINPFEIDFNAHMGKSESLEIDLGAPYASAITSLEIYLMMQEEGERGQWTVYDNPSYQNPIASGVFYGAPNGATFEKTDINSPRAFSYLTIQSLDNGNRTRVGDWGAGLRIDGSDFGIYKLRFPLICNLQEALILEQNKYAVDNYINTLKGDGPTRSNIGLVWAWRAISSVMKGKWGVSTTHPSEDSSKFIIMLTQGKNFYPEKDDSQLLEVCKNIKDSGIELYYITFDADTQTQTLGQQCASSGSYYNTSTPTDLTDAFKKIANRIKQSQLQSVLSN